MPREAQRGPGRPREAQKDPGRPIYAQRGSDSPREAQGARSPKQPTHTDKKHTETFHRLPTIGQHPEKETIKKQSQTITQATETFAKLSIYNECIPHI